MSSQKSDLVLAALKWIAGLAFSEIGKPVCAVIGSALMSWWAYNIRYDGVQIAQCAIWTFLGILASLQVAINSRWLPSLLQRKATRKGLLTFDGPILPPYGWKTREGHPQFSQEQIDGQYVMRIESSQGPHAIDYKFSSPLVDHRTVAFRVRELQSDASMYVQAEGPGELWFKVNWEHPMSAPNQPHAAHEWTIPIAPVPDGKWSVYRVDFPGWFSQTFGQKGIPMKGIVGFRLRGAMVISEIRCD